MITAIIPTYKKSNELKSAIYSILNQTYKNLLVFVTDDASNDNTKHVIRNIMHLDNRIYYHEHEYNIGGNRNFDFGLRNVNSKYFCFLSNDDLHKPHFFQHAIDIFSKYPDIGFCVTEVEFINNDGDLIGHANIDFHEGYYPRAQGLKTIIENGKPPCWTGIIFKSEILKKIGYLDAEVGGPMDYDFVNRAAAYFPFYVSKKVCATFKVDSESWGHSSGYEYVWPGFKKLISNITDDINIDIEIRQFFLRFYTVEFKNKIYHYGKQEVKRKNYNNAFICTRILISYFKAYRLGIILFAGTIVYKYLYNPNK